MADHFESSSDLGHGTGRGASPRHSILDLAPLELECMSALWPMGEGSVRDIHRELTMARPRAYTTVLTIMDRLEQKGIVTRRRVGRAYRYRANLTADEARLKAVEKIVTGFFDGSLEALAAHLAARRGSDQSIGTTLHPIVESGVSSDVEPVVEAPAPAIQESPVQELDESLL